MNTFDEGPMDGKVMVDVNPVVLEIGRAELQSLVERQIANSRAFAAGLLGDQRREALEEIDRCQNWLDGLRVRPEDTVVLLVAEQAAMMELAREQSEEEAPDLDLRKPYQGGVC